MLFTLSICVVLATPIIGGLSLLAIFVECTKTKRASRPTIVIVEEHREDDPNKIAESFLANETRKSMYRSWTKAGYIIESGH